MSNKEAAVRLEKKKKNWAKQKINLDKWFQPLADHQSVNGFILILFCDERMTGF